MKKSDAPAFGEFMAEQAKRYARDLHVSEIATWFEFFAAKKVKFEDFKIAWNDHKNDPKWGGRFPTQVDLERQLRRTSDADTVRDWRCCEAIGERRCGFPGGIFLAGSRDGLCAAHFQIKGSASWSESASMQIIEASTAYMKPKTAIEEMTRGAELRKVEGERWRASHPDIYKQLTTRRRHEDRAIPAYEPPSIPRPVEDPLPLLDDLGDANALAAMASAEERA